MKLRVFDLAGGDMNFDLDSIFKNPSVIPSKLLSGEDPLLKVMISTERLDKKIKGCSATQNSFEEARLECLRKLIGLAKNGYEDLFCSKV